jgi:hypothetical protein
MKDNQKLVEEFVGKIGQTVNAQLTITWDTKQTLEQYLEILSDNGDEFVEEDFLEYLRNNAIDYIEDTTRYDGYIALEKMWVLVNDQGEEIDDRLYTND